jgi:hypothetical protein
MQIGLLWGRKDWKLTGQRLQWFYKSQDQRGGQKKGVGGSSGVTSRLTVLVDGELKPYPPCFVTDPCEIN